MKTVSLIRAGSTLLALCSLLVLNGCQSVVGGGTNLLLGGVESKIVPPVLKTSDLNMGCTYAVANVPLIASFRSFYGDPSGLESVLQSSAQMCADLDAGAEELRYLRAQRDKRTDEALDARIAQKRLLERTARRQLASFDLMRAKLESKYKFEYGHGCPRFRNDFDELIYLLGSLGGLQAFVNDIAAQHPINVSSDIPPRAEAAMACLNSAKWWGVPQAIRATVWAVTPGGAVGHDVAGTFDLAMAQGEREGMRVSHVLAGIAAASLDDRATVRAVIRRAATMPIPQQSENYRYIDEIGLALLQEMSDRDWTIGTGSRTPVGSFGTFWDEKARNDVDANQFLN